MLNFRKIRYEKLLKVKALKFVILFLSCFLYIHGTANVYEIVSELNITRSAEEYDLKQSLEHIFNSNKKTYSLGGVNFITMGIFIRQLKQHSDLLLSIKYISKCIDDLGVEVKTLALLQAQNKSVEFKDAPVSTNSDQSNSSDQTTDSGTTAPETLPADDFQTSKIMSDIEIKLETLCAAHLILFIAFKEFFDKEKPRAPEMVINTIKAIVAHSLKQRDIKFKDSFYNAALSNLLIDNKNFKFSFAQNWEQDRKDGKYRFVLKLMRESMAFCKDAMANEKLAPAFAALDASGDIIRKKFPSATLEARSLLALVTSE